MRRDLNRVTSQSKTKRRLINGGGELCARDGSKQASLGIGPLWVEMDDCEFDPDLDPDNNPLVPYYESRS